MLEYELALYMYNPQISYPAAEAFDVLVCSDILLIADCRQRAQTEGRIYPVPIDHTSGCRELLLASLRNALTPNRTVKECVGQSARYTTAHWRDVRQNELSATFTAEMASSVPDARFDMELFAGGLSLRAAVRGRHSVAWPGGLRWVSVKSLWPGLAQLPGASLAGRCPMTTAPSAALATIQPVFTDAERVALAGFLAGYRGLTREAYTLDLRQFTSWCRARSLALFAVRRTDIEGFAWDLEARGRARATVTRRLSTIAGSCKYAVEEELLGTSPAAHVRRPRVDYESHAVALHRNELGALLVAAGLGTPGEHALISLLALNGLRVSEATGVGTRSSPPRWTP